MRKASALILILLMSVAGAAQDPYLKAAMGTAQWLRGNAIRTPDGLTWAADPRDPRTVNTTLYGGLPGPVLFFLQAYRYTGKREYLASARAGADTLSASVPQENAAGLYEGLAGTGFTLGEAYLITRDAKYRAAALRCVELLRRRAQPAGRGVEWNDTTDVIAGGSGTGLFLLWADKNLKAPGARALAIAAGRRLLDLAQRPAPGQMKWMMDPKYPREMPNFSHGTAGVAYFLATLYQETRDKEFLDAALAGANYLLSIADKQGDYCLIYHDDAPEGKRLFYLSWCHGPAGTARLFYRLYQVTKDPVWMTWMKKSAQALIASGAPQKVVTPGDWDNVSVCCGVTGQAGFFLSMYQLTRNRQYLDLARQATQMLLAKAAQDERGVRWVQAEHRVRPDLLVAQTGLMQGASGMGLWLLHFSAFTSGKKAPALTLPDNPFPY
jgi:lantibiotic modifying enzyme